MEPCTTGTHFAKQAYAAARASHDLVHAGDGALGLDDLISNAPLPHAAADSPIALNGLRLHCNGAPAHERAAQPSASERRFASLAQSLCAPFRSHDDYILELSDIETGIAPVDSRTRATAYSLVQHAYGLRYLADASIDQLDDGQRERAGQASTVVAIAQQCGVPQVIGTLRYSVGQQLSLFDFFAPEPTTCWPHEFGKPAEYTRLAFHPVFDRMGRAAGALQRDLTRFYKLLVLRKLVQRCSEEILDQGARAIYFIATPHVQRFLSAGGLRLEPLPGALSVESDLSRSVRDAFPRYWRPEQPDQQPIPYLMSADLDEITVQIGRLRIIVAPDNSLRLAAMADDQLGAAAA